MPPKARPVPVYRWNATAARWQTRDGRFVSELAPRQALEGVITATQTEMLRLTQRLQAHTISLAEWQGGMAALSKRLHVTAALAAAGTGTYTPQQSGKLGAILKAQYKALDALASDIASGKQPLDGRLLNRARQYAQAGRSTWETIRGGAKQSAGFGRMRRLRHSNDSCAGCIAVAALGWVPVGTLPPIGQQQCRHNCLCSDTYAA